MAYLQIRAGEYGQLAFQVKDSSGSAIDLTGYGGYAIVFSAKRFINDSSAAITKSVGSGITITDEATGVGYVELSPSDTTSLTTWTRYFYEIVTTLVSGRPQQTDTGTLIVTTKIGL